MKQLMLLLMLCFLFSGCQQQTVDVDEHLPAITLSIANIPLTPTTADWSNAPNPHDVKPLLPVAATITPTVVTARTEDIITIDSQQPLHQLSISFWKDGKETFVLFTSDDQQFQYPKEAGDYVVVLFMETLFGTTQYVTAITVVEES